MTRRITCDSDDDSDNDSYDDLDDDSDDDLYDDLDDDSDDDLEAARRRVKSGDK